MDLPPSYDEVSLQEVSIGGTNRELGPGVGTLNDPDNELHSSFLDVQGAIKVTKNRTKGYGQFEFSIRAALTDELLLRGEVKRTSATIMGLDGTNLIQIVNATRTDNPFPNLQEFHIRNSRDILLGVLKMEGSKKMTLLVTRSSKHYSLNMIGDEDIMISRSQGNELLAKIHIPPRTGIQPFHCSIVFQERLSEPITALEKSQCISVALISMMVRNRPVKTKSEHESSGENSAYIGCMILFITIMICVVIIVTAFN